MTLVNFHRDQVVHQQQLAETLISNVNHLLIPEYITDVPDITSRIESAVDDLMCETSLFDIFIFLFSFFLIFFHNSLD